MYSPDGMCMICMCVLYKYRLFYVLCMCLYVVCWGLELIIRGYYITMWCDIIVPYVWQQDRDVRCDTLCTVCVWLVCAYGWLCLRVLYDAFCLFYVCAYLRFVCVYCCMYMYDITVILPFFYFLLFILCVYVFFFVFFAKRWSGERFGSDRFSAHERRQPTERDPQLLAERWGMVWRYDRLRACFGEETFFKTITSANQNQNVTT